jgi:hypothetical protein
MSNTLSRRTLLQISTAALGASAVAGELSSANAFALGGQPGEGVRVTPGLTHTVCWAAQSRQGPTVDSRRFQPADADVPAIINPERG